MNIWFWFKFLNFVNSLNFWGFFVKLSGHKDTKLITSFGEGLLQKLVAMLSSLKSPTWRLLFVVKFIIQPG